jgi:hypothetical protein
MPFVRKNIQKKRRLKKQNVETVIIITEHIKAEDTLFPEKVARANEMLKNNPHLLDGL